MSTPMKSSPKAAARLLKALNKDRPTDDLEERTDCPQGCHAEVDGNCPHGYYSAAGTLLWMAP
jgi:hypothetical protein